MVETNPSPVHRPLKIALLLRILAVAYLLLFFANGMLETFLVPPFQVPDEPTHWLTAYERAERFLPGRTNQCAVAKALPEHFEVSRIAFNSRELVNKEAFWTVSDLAKNCEPAQLSYGTLLTYPGVVLARVLVKGEQSRGVPALRSFYLSRIFHGLLIFALLSRLVALSFSKGSWNYGVLTLLAFCLSPLLIQQSFAISADVVILAASLSLINLWLNWERISKWDLALFFALVCASALTKPPSCVILFLLGALLLFMRRTELVVDRFSKGRGLLAILSVGFVLCAFETLLDHSPPANQIMGRNINLKEQLLYVASNPIKAFDTVHTAVLKKVPLPTLSGPLGWLDAVISKATHRNWVSLLIYSALIELWIFLLIAARSRFTGIASFSKSVGLGALGLVSVYIAAFLIGFTLFITWNEVGAEVLIGLQGRYFFSVLVFVPILIGWSASASLQSQGEARSFPAWLNLSSALASFVIPFLLIPYLLNFELGLFQDLIQRWW